jgi:hypothetical protein
VPATLRPGEENPAGRRGDFRDDDGDLLSGLEVFNRIHCGAAVGFSEGDQPGNPRPGQSGLRVVGVELRELARGTPAYLNDIGRSVDVPPRTVRR